MDNETFLAKTTADDFFLKSPEEEFCNYLQKHIDHAKRFQKKDQEKLYQEAFEIGKRIFASLREDDQGESA